ncbi:MAG TPA: aspartate aminotransferase family protein [Thioploca sp.]|nr:aspartate aminotransferase family protein [Thioploca sp.]
MAKNTPDENRIKPCPACDADIPKPQLPSAIWRDRLAKLQQGFPSPWEENERDQHFENTFKDAVALLDDMKHPRYGDLALLSYLGDEDPHVPNYDSSYHTKMTEELTHPAGVIHELVNFFDGMPIWNHPQTMANVIPPANTASIIGATLGGIFSPNIIEGDYSWHVAKTEIESAAMVADMIGWDQNKAGGLFTFGGTGCYLYGTKYALTRCLGKESRYTGIREDVKVLVSAQGHYAKQNCTDWSGLGMNHFINIQTDNNNCMDVEELKKVMEECYQQGHKIAMIVCTMGTTDAFAIDPIRQIREAIDEFQAKHRITGWPMLYADAVIGWAWLAFSGYNFKTNFLQFSPAALEILQTNYEQIKDMHFADAFGCDFHKTGWAPYNCSLFMVKNRVEFQQLMERPVPSYLHPNTDYNPGHYTLETSRTGSYSLAAWATLRFFGREGFRVMLGRIIEVQMYLRQRLTEERSLVCVNPDDYGFVTLFRVYPESVDAEKAYQKELNDPAYREQLKIFNQFQTRVANKLFDMLRNPSSAPTGWKNPPYTSYTAGFRAPLYAPDESDSRYFIYALKSYPMSPNSDEHSMVLLIAYVLKARELVMQDILEECKCKGRELVCDSLAYWGSNEAIHDKDIMKAE